MSIWVEIHCDAKIANDFLNDNICDAHSGSQPSFMVDNSSANSIGKIANQYAKNSGYIKKQGVGWVCRKCQKVMKEQNYG